MGFIQLVATLASIISIPLAVYYAHKTADATSDKARLEIIKTLSYKLSIEHKLNINDIVSVYRSKLHEHKIKTGNFGITDIINDLKSDIMSNAFIENETRSEMLLNLSIINISQYRSKHIRNGMECRAYELFMSPIPGIIFVLLIITNVVIALLYLPDFLYVAYNIITFTATDKTINYFPYAWESLMHFFNRSHLNISLTCLIAWGIVMLAQKHAKANILN